MSLLKNIISFFLIWKKEVLLLYIIFIMYLHETKYFVVLLQINKVILNLNFSDVIQIVLFCMLFLLVVIKKTNTRYIRVPGVLFFSLLAKEFILVWTKVTLMSPSLFVLQKGVIYTSPTYSIPSCVVGYSIHQLLEQSNFLEVVTLLQNQYGLPLKEVTPQGSIFYHEALSLVINQYFLSLESYYSPS